MAKKIWTFILLTFFPGSLKHQVFKELKTKPQQVLMTVMFIQNFHFQKNCHFFYYFIEIPTMSFNENIGYIFQEKFRKIG